MPDNPSPTNAVHARGAVLSTDVGDVPDALRRRYLTEAGRNGAGVAYYIDATTLVPSFRDRGRELVATRSDPPTVRDLVAIAEHRGWSIIRVQGAQGFRRQAWLAGRTAGLEVEGYRPTERDGQDLARRLESRSRSGQREPAAPSATAEALRTRREDLARPSQRLRIVETVLRERLSDPSAQARILAAARSRLAALLERGERPRPPDRRRDATLERQR
jgi:hypothetical protein